MAKKNEPGKNDFSTLYPELMKEWDWEKNDVDPTTIPPTYLDSVWWKCELGHEWTNSPRNRTILRLSAIPICGEITAI